MKTSPLEATSSSFTSDFDRSDSSSPSSLVLCHNKIKEFIHITSP
uniref:Uncharacterized protein n=1 Tax=Rhizophora mucronata TaxID=61149 RepID=A0A2P2MC88_RHIMU